MHSGGLLFSPSLGGSWKGLAISLEERINSMKRTWRAVTAALVGSAAVTAATLLLTLPAAQAATGTPVPPGPSAALAGTWVNTNHATRNIVDLVVSTTAKGITVDGFGACSPSLCEWGRIAGTVFGPDVSSATGTAFSAQWNVGYAHKVLLAVYSAPKKVPTLTVREFTTFTDYSHRSNYAAVETFTKGKPVMVTTTGTTAQDYPLGEPVSPVASLSAVWLNTAASGSVSAVILTRAAGLLQVHAYGYCAPDACNWGTVTGITFGASSSATTGGTFLAPYGFRFGSKLLDGTVNAKGTLLTVRIWTDFTDHSGRSNYQTTETFTPLR
jgi:hypothetical protein